MDIFIKWFCKEKQDITNLLEEALHNLKVWIQTPS